jgi:hypothetical protein
VKLIRVTYSICTAAYWSKVISNDAIAQNMNDLPESLKNSGLVRGGGSLTALPIIETQAGDVSAYIPTNNEISIQTVRYS